MLETKNYLENMYYSKIEELEKEKKKWKNLEKEYDEIIECLSKDLQKNKQGKEMSEKIKPKKNSIEEIKFAIDNHFTTLLITLSEMEKDMEERHVRSLLSDEMKIVVTYLNEEIEQLLKMKYKK